MSENLGSARIIPANVFEDFFQNILGLEPEHVWLSEESCLSDFQGCLGDELPLGPSWEFRVLSGIHERYPGLRVESVEIPVLDLLDMINARHGRLH